MTTENKRAVFVLSIQRLVISGMIAAHGWARWLAGGVEPFGAWLDGLGFPYGTGVAIGMTAL
ncbi:MAG TPA: hypothetical protein VJ984_05880 [Xanthomonadales bacterium]|nr:hypothetical protein [Xanthomonadales bacterium]